jgi:hypothetical protein
MDYTSIISALLSNNNKKWIADLLAEKTTVKCIFDRVTNLPTFRILCKAAMHKENDAGTFKGALTLLKSWEIFKLSRKSCMEFVIAFEREDKRKLGKYELTKTVVHEIRVTRPSYPRNT